MFFCNDRCLFGETSKRTIYKLFRSRYTFYGLPEGHANEFRWTSSVSSKCSKCGAIVSCILDDFGWVSRSSREAFSSMKIYLIHQSNAIFYLYIYIFSFDRSQLREFLDFFYFLLLLFFWITKYETIKMMLNNSFRYYLTIVQNNLWCEYTHWNYHDNIS